MTELGRDIHDRLYRCTRIDQGRHPSPSDTVLDSQSVKSAAGVHAAVGVDVGKQHHWTQAIYHGGHVGISAASVGHRCQHTRTPRGPLVLHRVQQQGLAVSRLHTIWVDGGNDCFAFMQWVISVCRWIVQVVLRPEQTKGEVLLLKRWVVERTFGWLMHCRRLVRDYELLPETSPDVLSIWR